MIIPYRCTHTHTHSWKQNNQKKKWDNNRPSPCGRLSLFRFSSSSQKIRLFLSMWRKNWQSARKRAALLHMHTRPFTFFSRLFRDVVGAVREREFHHHRLLGWGGDEKELSARPITVFPTYAHLNHLVSSYHQVSTQKRFGTCFCWSQVKYYLAAAAAATADLPVVAVCLCRILPAKFLDFIFSFVF